MTFKRVKIMQIKLGTNLILEPTFTEKVEKYRCKVVDMDDHFIYVDYPIDTISNKTVVLMEGTQLRATFIEETKSVFAFPTEVLGRKLGQIPMIRLSYPDTEEFMKIQRRNFVRVVSPIDIAIQYGDEKYQSVTDDISAGGVAIILNGDVKFRGGDEVSLIIPLFFNNGEMRYVFTTALVVRIWERDSVKIASLQFTNTDDLDRQHIVRFCFERQLLMRKKGLS